jgi:hypothetical protein
MHTTRPTGRLTPIMALTCGEAVSSTDRGILVRGWRKLLRLLVSSAK